MEISKHAQKRLKVCHYCGSKDREMTKDHVIPKAHGGKGGANKVDCCMICNRAKGCMTVEEFFKWAQDIVANALNKGEK